MPDTHTLIFWLSGVITPSLLEMQADGLKQLGDEKTNPPSIPDYRKWTDQFCLGRMTSGDYFKTLVKDGKLEIDPDAWEKKVVTDCSVSKRVLEVINLLPRRLDRWLISDLPPAWLEGTGMIRALQSDFDPEKIAFLSEFDLEMILPDLWKNLPETTDTHYKNILFFDREPKRVISAINHGIPSAVYVDPRRLEREIVIRGFISRPLPVHTPPVTL
jgi:hypothetical protein